MANKFFNLPKTASASMNEEEKEIVQGLVNLAQYNLYNSSIANRSFFGAEARNEQDRMFSGLDFSNFNYADKNETTLVRLMQYCADRAGRPHDEESLKSPMTKKDPVFSSKFFSIISQATAPVVSATMNYFYEHVADIRNIGWGDSLLFTVPSKDIFYVNMIGTGITRGAVQKTFNQEITLAPKPREVTTALDWYQLASGRYDIGEYLFKVGRSFSADLTTLIYKTLDATYASLPAPCRYSGAFSTSEFDTMTQKLQAVNGSKVYGLGSLSALAKVLPENDFLKMPLADEWDSMGYVGNYRRISFIELPQVMVPNTGNTTIDLGVSTSRIYLMPMMADKPVKVGMEGDTVVFEADAEKSPNNTITVCTQMRYDVAIATASRYGIYDVTQ